ncbi:hypothetical protein HO173_007971 [Letharia columbiana]|uniref:DNA repair protein rad9 n=1 Tax=Letharia columbiana TaxID=112416 RepID=A0A8H6FS75_9LECA|nr:uncharacterized protein HO173_007971 [Letharia columbiana]KAF6233759.1 hypothetical protein HO173_007971 [Letharia columbiana]
MRMHTLSFSLTLEGVVRIHDGVLCLAKFSEVVSLEARKDKLILTALNSSKSAYASFSLDKTVFFEKYNFNASQAKSQQSTEDTGARFTCQLYNKALLSVFKGRLGDVRDKDTAVERCECNIQDQPDKTECRLIVKMLCRHGVTKTYKLTYESVEVMHALFNKSAAKNTWTIGASTLRSFAEYFGTKTEQLDISSEGGRATFTSYTEKIMNGRDVLKQPLQTSITVDSLDFEDFKVEDQLHIGISVKDFKAIVTHAETLKASITALYSFPTRPMQLSYHEHGMQCEFTLMTIGDYRGNSVTPAPAAVRQGSAAPAERATSRQSTVQTAVQPKTTTMPPPSQSLSRSFTREPQSQRTQRPSPPPPKASLDPQSLFLPADEDDDRIWGERIYDNEQDTLGWDASANNVNPSVIVHAVNSQEVRIQFWAVEEVTRKALRDCHHIRPGRKTQIAA